MAGDVNLFFNDYDDPHACEMEIMIAEEKYRRKGFAEEAVKLIMAYGMNDTLVAAVRVLALELTVFFSRDNPCPCSDV